VRWENVDGIELQTDRRKLKIVLKNLVGNALKFTPKGEIVAACERVGDQYRLTVRDTGVGIPRESLAHIFDMFQQVDSSETRSYGGAGLGLYIVKSLITQLGGQVQVESIVGQESIFTIVLPIEQGMPSVESCASALEPAPAAVAASAPADPSTDGEGAEHQGMVIEACAPAGECVVHVRRRRASSPTTLPLNRLLVQAGFAVTR
jgi:anti-sigma regulatory factor (Ser/Thr protein kinase)